MIIQQPPGKDQAFAVLQDYHLELCSQFALAWGNGEFAPADPRFALDYMGRNHDLGWPEYDSSPAMDPKTGFPYHLLDIPPEYLVDIHRKNIVRNYGFHPYTGLLSAMHMLGVYRTRLGVSDFVTLDHRMGTESDVKVLQPLIDDCQRWQEEWTAKLEADSETRDWLEPDRLKRNFTLLQIYDMLSLYFCINPESEMKAQTFAGVPSTNGGTTDVTLVPKGDGRLTVDPWPFGVEPLRVVLSAKRLAAPIDSAHEAILRAPIFQLVYTLTPAK